MPIKCVIALKKRFWLSKWQVLVCKIGVGKHSCWAEVSHKMTKGKWLLLYIKRKKVQEKILRRA